MLQPYTHLFKLASSSKTQGLQKDLPRRNKGTFFFFSHMFSLRKGVSFLCLWSLFCGVLSPQIPQTVGVGVWEVLPIFIQILLVGPGERTQSSVGLHVCAERNTVWWICLIEPVRCGSLLPGKKILLLPFISRPRGFCGVSFSPSISAKGRTHNKVGDQNTVCEISSVKEGNHPSATPGQVQIHCFIWKYSSTLQYQIMSVAQTFVGISSEDRCFP